MVCFDGKYLKLGGLRNKTDISNIKRHIAPEIRRMTFLWNLKYWNGILTKEVDNTHVEKVKMVKSRYGYLNIFRKM